MPEETDRLHTASRDVLALLQRTAAQIARSTKNPDVRLAAAQEEKKLAVGVGVSVRISVGVGVSIQGACFTGINNPVRVDIFSTVAQSIAS